MKIAISQRIIYHKGRAYDATEHGWYDLLKGHNLFFVPNTLNQDFDVVADNSDSFIITGGDDSDLRRSIELKLASKMLQRNKPVLGICHGAFLLTEMLGGTVEEIKDHSGVDHPIFYHREVLEVNSYHSLGIKSLPNSVEVICRDYSGNIEAFVDGNLAGIVWHPERMEKPWIPPEIAWMLKI
jgi:gamma-glutamyl-gamma-aminobutyrate hydrolase PuuD